MDEQLRIDADREHLFRILSNLTRNAMQAIEQKRHAARARSASRPGATAAGCSSR